MQNLENAKRGIYYKIDAYSQLAPTKIKRRLLELGLTNGQKVRVVRKSLLGKAYLIEVRGYTLSLRRDLACFVLLER